MYKYTKILFFSLIAISLISPKSAEAFEKISYASSKIRQNTEIIQREDRKDIRVLKLEQFLGKNYSSLYSYSRDIIQYSDENNIPWNLIVSIAGVESNFCKRIPYKSANCWGWENGKTRFSDLKSAIKTVSETLGKKYYSRGLNTPEKIGPIYAPPSKTWAQKVRYFMIRLEHDYYPTEFYVNLTI